jgi:effector-binding domain-containing protein
MAEDVLYRIEVKDLPAQRLAVIAGPVSATTLRPWLRAAFDELLAAAGEVGAGPPFAVLPPADDEDVVAAEAALPLVGEIEPHGRIALRSEPGFRALVALHRGSYEMLPLVHRALSNALSDQGAEPAGPPREIYLTDPARVTDPSHNLVETILPLAAGTDWEPSQELFTKPLVNSV